MAKEFRFFTLKEDLLEILSDIEELDLTHLGKMVKQKEVIDWIQNFMLERDF